MTDTESVHAFVAKPDNAPRGHYEPAGESCAVCGKDPRGADHRADAINAELSRLRALLGSA